MSEKEFEVRKVENVQPDRLDQVIKDYVLLDKAKILDVEKKPDGTYTITVAVPKTDNG